MASLSLNNLFIIGKKLLLIFALTLLSACSDYPSIHPDLPIQNLLTGECLIDNNLEFIPFPDRVVVTYNDRPHLALTFQLNLEQSFEKIVYGGYIPPENVFNAFGDNSNTVRVAFNEVWSNLYQNQMFCDATTILYKEGFSLTADKEFAGYAPGENINCIIFPNNHYETLSLPSEFSDYSLLARRFGIKIPIDEYSLVDEDVIFRLTVPVKVGLYLTWLNDQISDPESPFPYREETLTCNFTFNKGLR